MKHALMIAACGFSALATPALAATVLPAGTLVVITPREEITSKHLSLGTEETFSVVNDVSQDGVVVIPRGSAVKGTVTFKTGKAVGGKSGKFEITFQTVTVNGHDYAVHGKARQEGQGNTTAALLGSMLISGHSAVMRPGQLVNVFTAAPIPS